jgi:predicted GNAT family acetyltransferase
MKSKQDPFFLTPERAVEEATLLIRNRQLWVHLVRRNGDARQEIASIAAVTRTCNSVAAITKVYTNPNWRARGCAERLVRRVCKQSVIHQFASSWPLD